MKQYGIDVSHHQDPAALPWARIAEGCGFCIVRGSYGQMRDRKTVEFVKRARTAGLKVGLYHFFRVSQDPEKQLAIFRSQLELAGIGVGDIVPALDLEADPFPTATPVTPGWQPRIKVMLDALVEQFGECLVYITSREFAMLGAPEWLLERPLWVAHYTKNAQPAVPGGRDWAIWQHRVGPFVADGQGGWNKEHPELDQNRLRVLPLIERHEPVVDDTRRSEIVCDDAGLEDLLTEFQCHGWERIDEVAPTPTPARAPEVDTGAGAPPSVPPTPTPVSSPPSVFPTLRRGDKGEGVRELQRRLGVVGDGVFGRGTEAQLREFQGLHGLKADGVAGPKTWAALPPPPSGSA